MPPIRTVHVLRRRATSELMLGIAGVLLALVLVGCDTAGKAVLPLPAPEHWTFERLTQQNNEALEQLLKSGVPVTPADVAGWDYRGWNINCMTQLIGTRKFKKGFYQDPATGAFWGYNMTVRQGGIDEPWLPTPSEQSPKRYYFFGVDAPQPNTPYPNALVVDYRQWPRNCRLDPVRYTVDYLSAPDPSNKNLLVGKSYSELPFARVFLGFFIIERYNESHYHGP
jgi:hypothetical protein